MLKQRDIQEQQRQQSETSMQTNLLFLFIPLNRKEATHTIKVRSPSTWWWSDVKTWSLLTYFASPLKSKALERGYDGAARLHV